jgi:hypothetical protein
MQGASTRHDERQILSTKAGCTKPTAKTSTPYVPVTGSTDRVLRPLVHCCLKLLPLLAVAVLRAEVAAEAALLLMPEAVEFPPRWNFASRPGVLPTTGVAVPPVLMAATAGGVGSVGVAFLAATPDNGWFICCLEACQLERPEGSEARGMATFAEDLAAVVAAETLAELLLPARTAGGGRGSGTAVVVVVVVPPGGICCRFDAW